MIIGTLRELKNMENRVGLIPSFVTSLSQNGHDVMVESGAGKNAGFSDEQYLEAGAKIVSNASDVFECADMIVKVKEPLSSEFKMIKKDQVIFTYFHLAPDYEQTKALIESQAVCIAYETVTDKNGMLPLLAPMSSIAGRMSVIVAANILQTHNNGSGVLISGAPGVPPANVVIIGGGCVGLNAAAVAYGVGAGVTVIDNNVNVLNRIDGLYHGRVRTIYSNKHNITAALKDADIVIGGVLIAGARAPKLITREMLRVMKCGSVIVDVAIDQGGCCETSRATTHSEPTYEVDGIVHYCVANMPGAFSRTSTIALSNSTFPYINKIANMGYKNALVSDSNLLNGLNIMHGNITNKAVAEAQNLQYVDPMKLLKA